MNRETYDQLVEQAINEAIEAVGEGGNPLGASPTRLRHALTKLAQRVERATRDYHLMNLTTADELAQAWGVTNRAVQMLAKRRHERFGVGMRIGNKWVFAVDEIPLLEQDLRRKQE